MRIQSTATMRNKDNRLGGWGNLEFNWLGNIDSIPINSNSFECANTGIARLKLISFISQMMANTN
jgi:hypothetical protein